METTPIGILAKCIKGNPAYSSASRLIANTQHQCAMKIVASAKTTISNVYLLLRYPSLEPVWNGKGRATRHYWNLCTSGTSLRSRESQ